MLEVYSIQFAVENKKINIKEIIHLKHKFKNQQNEVSKKEFIIK